MKRSFLVFSVAFLSVLVGCARKKKSTMQSTQGMIIKDGVSSGKPLIIQVSRFHISKKNKREVKTQDSVQDPKALEDQIRLVEARLSDIPSHMLVKPISACCDAHGCYTLISETSLAFEEIKKFYVQEMEVLGWQKGACFESEELLCSFKKNNSSCILSLRPALKRWGRVSPATIHVYVQR